MLRNLEETHRYRSSEEYFLEECEDSNRLFLDTGELLQM